VPAVPDVDLARIRQFCDSSVPVRGKSVTIFDCRAPWHPDVTDWSRVPVAQLRYDPASDTWTLNCADHNSRRHRYDDIDPGTADELLNEINEDPTGIFWG
jgi:Protein of unknown function (DUF3024)